jgi:hypothetical protein
MKRLLAIIIIGVLAIMTLIPSVALAQRVNIVEQGGTGRGTLTTGALLLGNGINPVQLLSPGSNGQVLQVTGGVPAWGAAPTSFSTSTIRSLFSALSPFSYDNSTGVFSLLAGYTVPLTASTTQWSAAYASTTALTPSYIRGLFSASSPLSFNSTTGNFTLSTAGDWTGTFDGQEGSWYRDRANHTGTQLSSTISDLTATVRGLFSSTATGLTYTSGTGVFSLTGGYSIPTTASQTQWDTAYTNRITSATTPLQIASNVISVASGYNIPLTASTTDWQSFFTTPSTRITAGTGLSWAGNTLNAVASASGLGTTTPWTVGQLAQVNSNGLVNSIATSSLGLLTTNVAEGSNLYYTDARVGSYISASTTLPGLLNYWTKSGSNLYYTSGNVGIGTTTPAQALSVVGGLRLTGGFFDGANASGTTGMLLESTGTSTRWIATSTLALGLGTSFFQQNGNSFGAAAVLGTNDAQSLQFETNNSVKMTILSGGNVGIGVASPSESLDVVGDIRQRNSRTYTMTRSLPTTLNTEVDIGSISLTNGAGSLWVSVTVPSGGYSVAKEYVLPIKYAQTSGSWTTAAPISDTGSYSTNDFALDVNIGGAVASLRLRNTSGSTAGTAYIVVRHDGVNTDTFTASSATSSVAAPVALFGSTPLAQVNGNVGIGITSPSAKTHIVGTTEQLRIGYDTSNYLSTTLGSTGGVTFNAVGSGSKFTFSDPVDLSSSLFANGSEGTAGYVLQSRGTALSPQWVATSTLGISGGGGSGTVTSVGLSVPTGFAVSGSPVTTSGTLALAYDTGYEGLKTASSTQWNAAYASTTALTPSYIRGLFSGTSPISYNSGTGAIGITADGITDTELAFNTGQNLTTASTPTHAGLRLSSLTNCDTIDTDGSGNLACGTDGGGGGGTPGGSDTQFQYNNGGAFGGASTFAFDDATGFVGVGNFLGNPIDEMLHVFSSTTQPTIKRGGNERPNIFASTILFRIPYCRG